jgi:hypothetical protein
LGAPGIAQQRVIERNRREHARLNSDEAIQRRNDFSALDL